MSAEAPRRLDPRSLRLFVTADHDCGYLDQQRSRNLVVDPETTDQTVYEQLIGLGFRRSGDHLYRPYCDSCSACRALRVPATPQRRARGGVEVFRPNRSQRRCWRRNRDLNVRWQDAEFRDDHYSLFERYVAARHADGGMDDVSPDGYRAFLLSEWCEVRLCEARDGDGRLLSVAVVDQVADGLSAVYTFFDPEDDSRERGLGTFAVLSLLDEAARRQLPWVYLGYWVYGCRKMDYKAKFAPNQLFIDNRWFWSTDLKSAAGAPR